jgi:hypothetical protein
MKPLTSFLDTDGCWYVIPLPCYLHALVSQGHTLESLFCTKVKHFVTHAVYSALKSSNMTLKLSYFTLGYVSKKWETCFVQSFEKLIPLSITLELTLVYAIYIDLRNELMFCLGAIFRAIIRSEWIHSTATNSYHIRHLIVSATNECNVSFSIYKRQMMRNLIVFVIWAFHSTNGCQK